MTARWYDRLPVRVVATARRARATAVDAGEAGAAALARAVTRRPLPAHAGPAVEDVTVVVDRRGSPSPEAGLRDQLARSAGVPADRVVDGGEDPGAVAASAATPLVCLVSAEARPRTPGWLAALREAVRGGGAVASAPAVAGVAGRRRHGLRPTLGPGGDLHLVADAADGAPLASPCLLVPVEALQAVGGLGRAETTVASLVWRLTRVGRVVTVPAAVVVDARPAGAARRAAIADLARRHGPWVARAAAGEPPADRAPRLRFTIDVAAPNAKVAPRWGDTHLAADIAAALGRLGHDATVRSRDRWSEPAAMCADVRLVLRGLARAERRPGQVHVLWVISHPDTVTDEECDAADLVAVASEPFAAELARRTATPVVVLHQATDPERFRPRPPDPRFRAPVAFVGKTRDVFRPVVRDAVAAGLPLAVWGTGWEAFLDPTLLRGGYVPNSELPLLYASVDVVLNDHWDDMRRWGFVSNRCFDAVAAGAAVVSDHVDGLDELFDGAVVTYHDAADLAAAVRRLLEHPEERRRAVAAARHRILQGHTFDHRARALVEAVRPLLARIG